MAGKKNNATSSWSGYNHQGKVGIFLALKELSELLQKDEDFCNYSVQFDIKLKQRQKESIRMTMWMY